MTKTIALTGATGFVGGHLMSRLTSQGFHVKALTRRPQPEIQNVTWISGDLDNDASLKELVENADAIINVAGLVKAKNKDDFLNANADAVSKLVSLLNPKQHFIQISSLAAREPQISDYAFSKYQGEVMLQESGHDNWTIIRPPGIYGPNDFETLKIFKMLKSRFAFYPANKDHRASWIFVDDLVEAIIHTINNQKYINRTLEMDDDAPNGHSHEEYFNTASEILNISPVKITIPKFLLSTAGHINDIMGRIFGYAPMVSSKKVNELCHPDWICRKTQDFQMDDWAAKTDLKTGLKETLDWYKKNKYI
ncbi:NAD-dependent epimerase/dehydratase family protein [Pseudemcibacter aquimaris]|uniref:NAD-dependent epimerase/dehydratase family protein n=1 Tax=Pseudemcibacter aquimaris TaxID=2857064 RepID=UPI002011B64D|nr:NAD(P)-dependent oxidoreductase [Pseudemcibacter aquimaris]MCC3860642.1 NAD(P)-dependent oxidoreductase [Pseudemcibacter aquimaris]WDU59461.1 NAD(P)-dependent oxidoreductase [Pseudemcibacter aquimaris]